MISRECVCGCDVEIPLPLTGINAAARTVQTELLEWDGARLLIRGLSNNPESPVNDTGQIDPFIEAGGRHYEEMLDAIHGTRPFAEPPNMKAVKRWIKFSRKERKKWGRNTGVVRPEKELSPKPEDLDRLDRLHPELSFTGPDPDGRKLSEEAGLLDGGDQNG